MSPISTAQSLLISPRLGLNFLIKKSKMLVSNTWQVFVYLCIFISFIFFPGYLECEQLGLCHTGLGKTL